MSVERDRILPQDEQTLFAFETLAVIREFLEIIDPTYLARRAEAFEKEKYFVTVVPSEFAPYFVVTENPALGEVFVFGGPPDDPERKGICIDDTGITFWEGTETLANSKATLDSARTLVADLQKFALRS